MNPPTRIEIASSCIPSKSRGESDVNPAQTPTLAYFGHVVETGSCGEFERLADLPSNERARLTNQIWTLSLVTVRKYRHIVPAVHCVGAAIVTGLLAYVANLGAI